MPSRAKVAIVRTSPDTVLDDIGRLCDLAGMKDALSPGHATILKENISWHLPFPGANTTPWQLEGVIKALRASGFDDLVCVGNNTVVTDPVKGERLCRLRSVLEKYGIEVLYNFKPGDMRWEVYRPRAKMLVLDRIYPDGIRIPDFFHGKNIVHLPTVKTHIYTTTTGAMKNAFGGLLSTKRHYTHSVIHQTLVDLLAIQKEIHTGIFAVLDGTICGNGPGPRTMKPVRGDILIASSDCVAADAVSSRLMGFDPLKIDYIRLAHERGLGIGDPAMIELVGDRVDGLGVKFGVGDNLPSRVGDLLWFG
ncbi:MAG: DUF362 domain-containing protein, partial [Deltaproteobacteria bacterium]